jgi:hypothetical protein
MSEQDKGKKPDPIFAEFERLARIEAAAREVVNDARVFTDGYTDCHDEQIVSLNLLEALRAALEGK